MVGTRINNLITGVSKLRVIADVKCYHCGYVSGQLVGKANELLRPECFQPSPTYTKPLPRRGDRLSCGRCGGPVYLDDVRPDRDWQSRYVITAKKRFANVPDYAENDEEEEENLAATGRS
ncbi:MAG: hypothetical protein HYX92_20240 [Chloroflexi bacterium]|nr:hypothetical protein [Chloroflexota bacterium]